MVVLRESASAIDHRNQTLASSLRKSAPEIRARVRRSSTPAKGCCARASTMRRATASDTPAAAAISAAVPKLMVGGIGPRPSKDGAKVVNMGGAKPSTPRGVRKNQLSNRPPRVRLPDGYLPP